MRVSIIGFPGCGKSTVFKAIADLKKSGQNNASSSKPALGTVKIKDDRLEKLASIFKPKKISYEELVFTDLPGFNLTPVKEAETIMHVVGAFSGRDTIKDIDSMETEFIVSDLAIIEKRLPILEKEIMAKAADGKEHERQALVKCRDALNKNNPIRAIHFSNEEEKLLSGYQFLSQKPVFVILNLDEENDPGLAKKVQDYCNDKQVKCAAFSAKVEAELKDLDANDIAIFREEMGVLESARDRVIRTARETVGSITFFTVKGDETKAWPVKKGIIAHEAAGKIHTDIKKGFIKAEVVGYNDFARCGSFHEAKKRGLLRLEGKEYVVKDGDIINFKFNK